MKIWYIALFTILAFSAIGEEKAPRTWTVSPGQSIQAKIEQVSPGDTIQILPGVYNESIIIKKDNITIKGLEYEGEYAVLNAENMGGGFLEIAVGVSAENIRLEGLHIENYTRGGIMALESNGLYISDVRIARSGKNGIFVTDSQNVKIERCIVRDAKESGINLNNVQEVNISQLEVYSNLIGLIIFDCLKVTIFDSSIHHNTSGIILAAIEEEGNAGTNADHLTISYSRIVGNGMYQNNGVLYKEMALISFEGVGIHVMGFDHVEISNCYIESNSTYGIMIEKMNGDINDILPNHTYVHHNHYAENGTDPAQGYTKTHPEIPPGDIYWDETGERNQFQEGAKLKTWPEDLVVRHGGVHTDVMHFL